MKLKNYHQKRPPHIYLDKQIYFLSVRTQRGMHYLKPEKYKEILLKTIEEKVKKFQIKLYAWAILDNHYHLLIKSHIGKDLPKFIGEVNGKSAKLINNEDASIGQKIWSNYFDKCIRNKVDFYKYLNYIHQNPIKHHNVKDLHALAFYKLCSYGQYLNSKDKEWLDDCFRKYPIVDFVVINDEF